MRAALALSALAALSLACAAPCEKVQSTRDAFVAATSRTARPVAAARARADGGAHLSLSIPYELIDATIARELGRVPTLSMKLPAIAGTSLGSVRVGVESVRSRPAPADELGFRVILGLRAGKRTILTVNVDARIRPRLDPRRGTLAVALSGRDVIALEPSLGKQGRKQLGDWVWSQLPGSVKMVVNRSMVNELVGELADQLMAQAASLLRRELLDDLGELARFEIDLPDQLPLRGISLQAGERYLDLDLRTPLSVSEGLAPGHARVEGLHPNLVQVRISGDALAALANHAIREGRIPERWSLEGEPDPKGEVYAGVGWAEGTRDPLELHLWKLDGDCAHVILRGEPHLELAGRSLELGTRAAKVDSVVGSAKVRAGLFFSRTARRGVELIERTAASTEIEIGTTPMIANIAAAEVRGDEVVLGLRLSQKGRGR